MAQITESQSRGGQPQPTTVTVPDEQVAAQANDRTVRDMLAQALAGNRAFVAQAKPATAAAQASQTYDQTVKLSRQMNGVIRLLLGQLDATD